MAFDEGASLYISETGNHRIRRVVSDGMITTDAGRATAGFSGDPMDLAVDRHGNPHIADFWNHRIRMVDADGFITTVAGSGTALDYNPGGFSEDGGAATDAELNFPGIVQQAPRGNCP